MPDIYALRRAAEYAKQKRGASRDKNQTGPRNPGQNCQIEGTAVLLRRDGGRPLEIKKDFPIIALTLSPKGLSFLANHELLPEDRAEVKLPAKNGDDKKMPVRIIEARRAGMRAFEIAAVFASEN